MAEYPKMTLLQLLTRRQFEVAGLVAQGLSDKEIADKIGISVGTVNYTIYQAMDRLEITKRTVLAVRYGVEKDRGYYEGT